MQNVSFVRGGATILDDLSFRMHSGEQWVVLGPNGSGKSTFASILAGTLWPTRGSVRVLGKTYGEIDLRAFRGRLGFFQPAQQASLHEFHPRMSALETILTGYDGSLAVYRDYPEAAISRARELFQSHLVGAARSFPETRPFARLSSGERRKTLLLRMLMPRPELVILDEPYESLDIPSRVGAERMLQERIAEAKVPSIVILHRVEEIPRFATHLLLLKAGRVFAAGPIDELLQSDRISELYEARLKIGRDSGRYYCIPLPPE